ncbi:MAG: peptidoglycan DD-metalloendopeptidase family protein [Patescibacteria group bacterium]
MNTFFRFPFIGLIVFFAFLFSLFFHHLSFAADPQELKNSIEQKSLELKEINTKIQETQKGLEETQEEGQTLKKEIGKIGSQLNQLNLGIRSSEVTISKLGLEVESLQYDIVDTEKQISVNKEAIAEILRQLQQKEGETALVIFLKNKSLADSAFEVQGLSDLNAKLSVEITDLRGSKTKLAGALDETADKKHSVEIESFNLKNKKGIVEDVKKEKQVVLDETKNKESNYQKILSDLEKKQNVISDGIEELEDALRRSFDPTLLPLKRPGVLIWPILNPRITQNFGEISRLYRGKPHNGMDFGVSIGTPIFAADDGEVMATGNNGRFQYGKYVLIKHNNNLATLYAHLSLNSVVKKGDVVKRGQIIGYSGNTGYAIGRGHLHFGLYWEPSIQLQSLPNCNCGLVPIGVTVNPRDYLPL